MSPIIPVFWALALYVLLRPGVNAAYLVFILACFGTFTVLPFGNFNFLPDAMIVLVAFLGSLRRRQFAVDVASAAFDIRRFGVFTLFTIFAVGTAILLPRIFAGDVFVLPLSKGEMNVFPLRPTSQNISQAAYAIISLITSLLFYNLAKSNPLGVYKAICAGGVAAVVTGLLDLFLGSGAFLEVFRNANYAILSDQVLSGGSVRVVGLMPEASAYGGICVVFAAAVYFLRGGFDISNKAKIAVSLLAIVLVVMAFLSTSTSALVVLPILTAFSILNWIWRTIRSRNRFLNLEMKLDFIAVLVAGVGFLILFLFLYDELQPYFELINMMVFEKSQSYSFEERSYWNAAGMQAFFDTYGLGVGFGGHRSSSYVVALLSNTGVVGTLLISIVVLQAIFRVPAYAHEVTIQRLNGVKIVFLVRLLSMCISATVPDMGVMLAAFLGMIFGWSDARAAGAEKFS